MVVLLRGLCVQDKILFIDLAVLCVLLAALEFPQFHLGPTKEGRDAQHASAHTANPQAASSAARQRCRHATSRPRASTPQRTSSCVTRSAKSTLLTNRVLAALAAVCVRGLLHMLILGAALVRHP